MKLLNDKWLEFENISQVHDSPYQEEPTKRIMQVTEIVSVCEYVGVRDTPCVYIYMKNGNKYTWFPPLAKPDLSHIKGDEYFDRMKEHRDAQLKQMHVQYTALKNILMLHGSPIVPACPESSDDKTADFGGLA